MGALSLIFEKKIIAIGLLKIIHVCRTEMYEIQNFKYYFCEIVKSDHFYISFYKTI